MPIHPDLRPVFTTEEHLDIRNWLKAQVTFPPYDKGESITDRLLKAGVIDCEKVLEIMATTRAARALPKATAKF